VLQCLSDCSEKAVTLRTETALPGKPDPPARVSAGGRLVTRGDVAVHLALLLTTVAFFWPMIRPFGAHWYMAAGDFSRQFYPFRTFEAHEWWHLRIPLWSPDMFAGHPFQADIQTAVFYPLALANAILFGRHGFPFFALEGEVVVHTLLAGFFMYWLARYMTRSRIGALVAGLVFAFGGFITTYPAEQLPLLETAIWLPLIVLCLELAVGRGRPVFWHWLIAAGATFGVAMLAGHPQTDLFIVYATEAYLIWRLWRTRTDWRRLVVAAVVYPATAVGLAAIQILPSLELLIQSTREQMGYVEAARGYLPSALVEVFVPLWHGEKALSIGIVALSLAAIGAWASRREPLAFWTVAGLVALPLSVGGATPLFWVLYHLAPGWDLFRDQERTIYIFSFAGALLAARGVAELQRRDLRAWLIRRWSVAAGAAAVACLALYGFGPSLAESAPLRANLGLNALVLAALAVVLLVRAIPSSLNHFLDGSRDGADSPRTAPGSFCGVALAVLVGAELFAINFGNNLSPVSPDPVPRLARTAAYIQKFPEPFRVRGISEAVFPSDYGTVVGLPTIGGDTPFQLSRMHEMLNADADWRVWQILNVKFFLSDGGPLAGLKLVFQDGALKTYFMEDSLPRAWAVRAVEVAHDPAEAKQLILAPGYHPGNIVVLERPTSIGPFAPGPRPDVRITQLDPERIEIDANAAANAMLVLAQQYYPDWVAYRDGQPVTTFRANYLAMAFELPPGKHQYEIVYRPWTFYLGALISLATLAAAGAVVLSRRRGRGETSP